MCSLFLHAAPLHRKRTRWACFPHLTGKRRQNQKNHVHHRLFCYDKTIKRKESIMEKMQKWASTMTDRERFLRQMTGKSFDRSFNMEFGYWARITQWDIFATTALSVNSRPTSCSALIRLSFCTQTYLWTLRLSPQVVEKRPPRRLSSMRTVCSPKCFKDKTRNHPHYLKSSIVTPEDWKRCKEGAFPPGFRNARWTSPR